MLPSLHLPSRFVRSLVGTTILLLAAAAPCPAAGTTTTFYISPTGSDSHDGKTPLGAFATLAKAQEAVRTLNEQMKGDIVVEVARGDYFLKETLAFTERDSGMNGFSVIYKNHDELGSARLLGGRKVTGWTAVGNSTLYQAKVGAGLEFTTLYENGIRADLTRWPKRTSPFATSRGGYMVFNDTKGGFQYIDNAPNPEESAFDPTGKNFADAWMYGWNGPDGHRWSSATTAVTGATRERIEAKGCGLGWPPDSFLIEGSPDLLSRPGEYFYDKASGLLSYRSRFPGRIDAQEIIAPALVRLLGLTGTGESPVHDVKFSGLAIVGTDRIAQSNTDDWVDRQPASWEAAVYVKNARNVSLENCRIADTGGCGVTLDADTTACAVRGCLIEHTGYHGVSLKGGANNVVANCLIRYCGELRGHGSGISLMQGTHALSHLEIYYTPRAGLAIRGKGDTVEYVKIHDTVQDSGDQGAIYLVDPASDAKFTQCTAFHNYVDLSCMDRPPTAIYNDRDAPNTIWSNIDCGDSQMYIFRHDPQHAGTTMTFDNVNWEMNFHATGNESTDRPNPRFDRSKMEYAKIGVTPDFPAVYNDLAARPAAPLNLWTAAGDGQVTLNWTQCDRATSYNIWRANASGAFNRVGSVNVPATGPDPGTSFTDARLANGAPCRYVVTAVNKAGESPASVEIRATPVSGGPGKLTGTQIGDDPKGGLALDGNLRTYFESQNGWIGLDLGTPRIITGIRYAARSDNTDTTARLYGGEFQGSVDAAFSRPTTLYKVIASKGGAGTPVLIPQTVYCATPFRYVRFIGPGGKSLVAEIEFYGRTASAFAR